MEWFFSDLNACRHCVKCCTTWHMAGWLQRAEAKLEVLSNDLTLFHQPHLSSSTSRLIVQPAERPDMNSVLGRLGYKPQGRHSSSGCHFSARGDGVRCSPHPIHSASSGTPRVSPLSTNPHDLMSTPVSASGLALPTRRASIGSLKVGREGSGVPPRCSSPAMGMAPLSPLHAHQAGLQCECAEHDIL